MDMKSDYIYVNFLHITDIRDLTQFLPLVSILSSTRTPQFEGCTQSRCIKWNPIRSLAARQQAVAGGWLPFPYYP